MVDKLKNWWYANRHAGVLVFGLLVALTLPIVKDSRMTLDDTLHPLNDTLLTKQQRYRSQVLSFSQDDKLMYANCDLWFEGDFCRHATPTLTAQTISYQIINCHHQECSIIIHQGTFLKDTQVINYQASVDFIHRAIHHQVTLNRGYWLAFWLSVVGFLGSVWTIYHSKTRRDLTTLT